MISANNVTLQFGKRVLFDEVNVTFAHGNCYGVIGANGAGKSTFMKILSGELEANIGSVSIETGKRLAVLSQDHNAYNDFTVMDTVLMGHSKLWEIMKAKEVIYAKEDFSEADGIKASELEGEFAEMDGWNAEPDAAAMLSGMRIAESEHFKLIKDLDGNQRVRVLLAQALFGNPDILILDEPTNDLDLRTIMWLEDFLLDFKNTVIVVSHDRHFLDTVCTHIADIDYSKIKLYTGNYTFWYESSQLATRQRANQNKKASEKIAEMQAFIDRFSANASKSKQATSRRKMIEKIKIDDIQPSSRKYPGIFFTPEREVGRQILSVKGLTKYQEDRPLFEKLDFTINEGEKIALISENSLATTAFYQILADNIKADGGVYEWGQTVTVGYLPNHNDHFFNAQDNLVDWLRQYSENKDEDYVRGFLGRMLFTGEEVFKKSNVLSGGEKVRCMLSRMMLKGGNVLMFDEPTNHLDLESITTLNNAMRDFPGNLIFTSHDHTITQTVANRIIEIGPHGFIDKLLDYDDYITDAVVQEQRKEIYGGLIPA